MWLSLKRGLGRLGGESRDGDIGDHGRFSATMTHRATQREHSPAKRKSRKKERKKDTRHWSPSIKEKINKWAIKTLSKRENKQHRSCLQPRGGQRRSAQVGRVSPCRGQNRGRRRPRRPRARTHAAAQQESHPCFLWICFVVCLSAVFFLIVFLFSY